MAMKVELQESLPERSELREDVVKERSCRDLENYTDVDTRLETGKGRTLFCPEISACDQFSNFPRFPPL